MFLKTIYGIMATLGFCIIFNIKGRNVYIASLGGGLGWLVYSIFLNFSHNTNTAMFAAALFIGAYSEVMARVNKAPVTIFVVCALITLVPGGGMYYTMFQSIQGNIYTSLELGIETLANAGSLAVGILLVSSISRLVSSIKENNLKKHLQ